MKNFDELSIIDKNKFYFYQIWDLHNAIAYSILYIFFIIIFCFLLICIMLKMYYYASAFSFGFVLNQIAVIWFKKRIRKESMIIWGFKDGYKHFFNIDTKKDLHIPLKDITKVDD